MKFIVFTDGNKDEIAVNVEQIQYMYKYRTGTMLTFNDRENLFVEETYEQVKLKLGVQK